jgi:beta-glucosidase
MRLPDGQDALIEAVAAANPRTAVVLETNGPVRLPWLRQVPALLQAWYPGSGGGPAIARVLTGQVDASGRLPVSWPVDESQLPRPTIPGLDYKPDAGMPLPVFDYDIEGANVGYRWFATRGLVPAFPFGHGLSYTRFEYGPLTVRGHGRQVTARFTVRNSGMRAGTAIPQLYVHMPAGNAVPFRLAGWKRVELQPGQSREVTVTAEPRTLADFDTRTRQWRISAGSYRLALARSATDVVAEAPLVLVEQTF